MMLVKSANDMAVVLAEGVGGSIDGFSAMMNQTAQQLGMTQTQLRQSERPARRRPDHLGARPRDPRARDHQDLPEYEYFVHIPSIRYGRRVTQNFNKLIGRYPGADGFKTGFICASGYNLVASATRNGKRLIAVVLGASSGTMRAVRAAQTARSRLRQQHGWHGCKPSLGTVDSSRRSTPRRRICATKCAAASSTAPASDEDEDTRRRATRTVDQRRDRRCTFFAAGLQPPALKPSELLAAAPAPSEPIVVYTGPTRTGAALIAAVAADADEPDAWPPRQEGARGAARSPTATAERQADKAAKEPSRRRRRATPTPAPKAGATSRPRRDAAAAKPAKPKAAAKPKPSLAQPHRREAQDAPADSTRRDA